MRIGRLLKKQKESSGEDWDAVLLLLITDQLNMGSALIKEDVDKLELAKLNVEAAECVTTRSAFFPSAAYLKYALSLTPGDSKWTDHHDVLLEICSFLAEMAYCCGDFDLCRRMVDEVERNAKSPSEKLRVQFILVKAQASDGDIDKAIDIGLNVLNQLGIQCRKKPSKTRPLIEQVSMNRLLARLRKGYSETLKSDGPSNNVRF